MSQKNVIDKIMVEIIINPGSQITSNFAVNMKRKWEHQRIVRRKMAESKLFFEKIFSGSIV